MSGKRRSRTDRILDLIDVGLQTIDSEPQYGKHPDLCILNDCHDRAQASGWCARCATEWGIHVDPEPPEPPSGGLSIVDASGALHEAYSAVLRMAREDLAEFGYAHFRQWEDTTGARLAMRRELHSHPARFAVVSELVARVSFLLGARPAVGVGYPTDSCLFDTFGAFAIFDLADSTTPGGWTVAAGSALLAPYLKVAPLPQAIDPAPHQVEAMCPNCGQGPADHVGWSTHGGDTFCYVDEAGSVPSEVWPEERAT